MLTHLNSTPQTPKRAVVVGAAGFVGNAVASRLEAADIETVRVTRKEVDLLAADASEKLSAIVQDGDVVVLVSAMAPCKDIDMLADNMTIVKAYCHALADKKLTQLVNISSDAVYKDSPEPLIEASCAEPGSLHGAMHISREVALQASVDAPLVSIRPTLIYGKDDPHNGYGPNRFRRLAAEGKEIALFGEGEERRDHVHVHDVAEIVYRCITHKSTGVINAVSGTVVSFRECAEMAVANSGNDVAIKGSPRNGPMPHNGYRPFDNSGTKKAFPDFQYIQPQEGFASVQKELS